VKKILPNFDAVCDVFTSRSAT